MSCSCVLARSLSLSLCLFPFVLAVDRHALRGGALRAGGPHVEHRFGNAFQHEYDKGSRQLAYEALRQFDRFAQANGVKYSAMYGSLFGAHCVGDQLAWDDDIDLVVLEGWDKVWEAAGKNHDIGWLFAVDPIRPNASVKFYLPSGKPHRGRSDMPWRFPFLDIARMDCDHAECRMPNNEPTVYPTSSVFPLQKAPFGPLMIPVPRDSAGVLKTRYKREPCTVCTPLQWSHHQEMPRPEADYIEFESGVPCEDVLERLSDSAGCWPTTVAEFSLITEHDRAILLRQAGLKPASHLNQGLCTSINSIEAGSFAKQADGFAESSFAHDINVVFFNLQRGVKWAAAVEELRGANIIILNEVDVGMARSNNANVAQELARALGKHYVQAIEFVELTNGILSEIIATQGLRNQKGLHCNAILSDFPLSQISMVRLPGEDARLQPDSQTRSEVRLGSRNALLAKASVGGRPLWIYNTHLDGWDEQFVALKDYAELFSGNEPMVFAGDLHRSMDSVEAILADMSLDFTPNRASLATPTYGSAANNGMVHASGHDHTHLIGVRGVVSSDVTVSPPKGSRGELLSDSGILKVKLKFGSP